ncbi:nucleotidyltransferase domain-containing protein [Ferrimicrobium sp.]|uniref:nucleotidyltransferase family protein n=1 Tax=Ferrimicrobium sp. TaxID=2926050 RepID=UPI0026098BCF|nr:nucleotidyltransferase domain-containing protein [Ferrimicrobium sp.]
MSDFSDSYPLAMGTVTPSTQASRTLIDAHRDELDAVMQRYGATNPRLFGSVARGDATPESDIDILVDLDPAEGNVLFRAGGLNDEFRRILQRDVDVFSTQLLKDRVSVTAVAESVPL